MVLVFSFFSLSPTSVEFLLRIRLHWYWMANNFFVAQPNKVDLLYEIEYQKCTMIAWSRLVYLHWQRHSFVLTLSQLIQMFNSSIGLCAPIRTMGTVHYYSISFSDQMLLVFLFLPLLSIVVLVIYVIRRATTQFSYTADSLLFSIVATVFIQIARKRSPFGWGLKNGELCKKTTTTTTISSSITSYWNERKRDIMFRMILSLIFL